MARSHATVGQMMTYAIDRTTASSDTTRRSRAGDGDIPSLLGHMLEFVLMSPRSRDAFLRTVARTDRTTGPIGPPAGAGSICPDLVADILPEAPGAEPSARLGISLHVGEPFSAHRLRTLRASLGSSPRHQLVAISRKADHADSDGAAEQDHQQRREQQRTDGEDLGPDGDPPQRVITSTWSRLAKRMPKADPGHAHLWQTIGEIGESAASPVVQYPLDAKRLLTKGSTARQLRAHLDVLHHASRTLLGVSPHFSTRRGRTDAHLQAGVSRTRTGLEFTEVADGTPVQFVRTGAEPVPLGIGLVESDAQRAAAQEHLAALARRTAWRTDITALPRREEVIGTPATGEVEGARLLLWTLLDPVLLREIGFDPAPARRQPALTARTLGLRLVERGDEAGTLYRIWVGGRRRWDSLIPRVTREAGPDRPEETYAVAPRKNQSTADFVREAHRALRSLTITPPS